MFKNKLFITDKYLHGFLSRLPRIIRTRAPITFLVLITCILVLIECRYFFHIESLYPQFVSQLTGGMSFIIGISIVLIFVRRSSGVISALLLNVLVFFILIVPLKQYVSIVLQLYSLLLIEIVFFPIFRQAIIFQIVFSVVFLLLMGINVFKSAWHITISAPKPHEVIGVALFVGLLNVTLSLLRNNTKKKEQLEILNENLNRTVANLILANKELQDIAALASEKAQFEERRKLTSEIHDTIGYTLTNVIVMIESAIDFTKTNTTKAIQLLKHARKQVANGFEEIRGFLRAMRSVDRSKLIGLTLIHRIIHTFESATGIQISVEFGNLPVSFNEIVDNTIYHVVQEGMINALRHGSASKIRITMFLSETELIVSISDNGGGSEDIKEGIGFSGLRERLASIGGTLYPKNTENGFVLSAKIPKIRVGLI
jgi:signal transduction histidine kinase